jgi:integrase
MIDDGRCRTNINRLVHWIRRVFRWGVENEYVPVGIYTTLTAVPGLQEGRTEARESEPVQPVDDGTVNDTLAHMQMTVGAMTRLQLLTGARPGEVCSMRPCDITIQTDGVWCYRPARHKTEHHGKERRIYIGPEGQDVLRPFLDRDPEAFCFSPKEAKDERNEQRRARRQTPMTPSQRARKSAKRRKRPPRDHYTKDSYRRAVVRACEKADVSPWLPNQLCHSRATIIRERYGIEAAMVVLGHADAGTTEIYAQRNFEMAARVMREIG